MLIAREIVLNSTLQFQPFSIVLRSNNCTDLLTDKS